MNISSSQHLYSKGSILSPEGNYEWEGKSDGNVGTLKLTINGNDTKIIKFTKEELEDILNQSISRLSLDERLMYDFMGSDDEYTSPFLRSLTKKRRYKKNKLKKMKKTKSKRQK